MRPVQGEEGVLEQLEAEAAGEGQVLVIQRYILAVEHPALRLAPQSRRAKGLSTGIGTLK